MRAAKRHVVLEAWPLTAIVAIALIVTLTWYRGSDLIWGNDTSFPLNARLAGNYFHIPDVGLGAPDVRKLPFIVPTMGVLWLWGAAGLPYDAALVQRCLVVALLVISGASIYALVRLMFRRIEKLAALGAAVFYMFNLYSLTSTWTSMSNLIFHYSLLPLVVLLWLLALRRQSIALAVVSAVVWLVSLTPAYVTTPTVLTDSLLFVSVVLTEFIGAGNRRNRLAVFKCGAAAYGTWIGLNLYWLVPLFAYSSVVTTRGLQTGVPAELYRLNSVPFDKALRLAGYWGVTGTYQGSAYYPWRSYYLDVGVTLALVVPIVAALTFAQRLLRFPDFRVSGNERRYLVLATLLLVISIVAITGPFAPFGNFKEWLLRETGLIGPFRSAYQRFGSYVVLGYVPLIAIGISTAGHVIKGRTPRRLDSLLGTCMMIGVIALITIPPVLPLWTGSAFEPSGIIPSRRITMPSSYEDVRRVIDATPGDFTVLTFPFGKSGSVTPLRWQNGRSGYLGVEPFDLLSTKARVIGDPAAPWIAKLAQRVTRGGLEAIRALRVLDVRYVIVHRDVDRPYLHGVNSWIGTKVQPIAAALDRTRGLTRVSTEGNLDVYRVDSWQPFRVFAVRGYRGQSIYTLRRNQMRAVRYRAKSRFAFDVPAGELEPGEVLVVNHPFDSAWRASGASPISIAPGLTGFRVRDRRAVEVRHWLDRRFPLLLATIPLTLCLAGAAVVVAARRARVR